MQEHPDIPSWAELFGPKPPRAPHVAIVSAQFEFSDIKVTAMEIADRECARLLVNACLYRQPITDREIEDYSRRYRLTFVEAQAELRRLRDDA